MAAVIVTLGGITFGSDTPDLNSAVWSVQEIDGWDSPDLRMELLDLPGQDRQALGPIHHKGRAISLRGKCATPTDASFWASRARLAAATLLTTAVGSLAVAETATRKIDVHRSGRLLMRPWRNIRGFDFEVPLLAPDPRILANAPTTLAGAAGTATNNGNFKASPTLTITGSAAGPIVVAKTTGTTGSVSITTSVPAAQLLVVDFRARSVLLNGVNRYDLVTTTPTWFEIEPGANTITYSGGGTASLAWSDSWI